MSSAIRVCRWCKERQAVEVATDGAGQLVEGALPCGCAEKRAAGLCIDCSAPVQGKSLRCEPCKVERLQEYSRRWRENHPERARAVQRRQNRKRRKARRTKKRGDAIRERDREYRRKNRDRINANRRRRHLKDAGAKKAEHARRYKERHPDRVKAQQDAANARRAAEKREYMHRFCTKYLGEGRAPECRKCGGEVPWDGLGRPRLDCFECRPLDSRERKSPRVVALAESQAREDAEGARVA